MAKREIESFFAEIGNLDADFEGLFTVQGRGKKMISTFIRILKKTVNDPRMSGKVKYPFTEILVMVFFGVMAGFRTVAEIQRFCLKKERYLKRYVKLRHGIPSEDTIMRVLTILDLQELERAVVEHLVETFSRIRTVLNIEEPKMPHICVDGKEARGSGRLHQTQQEIRNLQTLHVYDVHRGICLISRQIDKKTNEIPVAQEVLSQLKLKDVLVTFDALHTQKETTRIIAERKGYFLGGLKGNQQFLSEEAQTFFDQEYVHKAGQDPQRCYVTTEKAHGNFERREFITVPVKRAKNSVFDDWPSVRSVVRYTKITTHYADEGKQTRETRYYVTNLMDAQSCAHAIRSHWHVENNLHWHLDVKFGDDANQTVNRNASGNLTLMKKMALSLYKLLQPFEKKGTSLNMISVDFSADFEQTMQRLLTLCDDKTLKLALDSVLHKK